MVTLPWTFYDRDTTVVARELLGKELVHQEDGSEEVRGRITEVEAYLGMVDPASHVYNGFTPRTKGTWGYPGRAYVFNVHGHWCLNAITLRTWPFGCVLIRGVEGVSGPGNLTKYFGIDGEHNGKDLRTSCLRIRPGEGPVVLEDIRQGPRINVSKGKDMHLRFRLVGSE